METSTIQTPEEKKKQVSSQNTRDPPYDEEKLRKFMDILREDKIHYRLYDMEVDSPEMETKWLEDEQMMLISRYHF